MTPFEFLLCGALIFVSAFMSSSEVALFSLNRFQVRALRDTVRPSIHKKIRRLLSDPGGLLVSILIANEVVNIALSSLMTRWVSRTDLESVPVLRLLPHWFVDIGLSTLITTPIVLFACEVTPKVIGARANQLIATANAGPLTLIYDSLKPVRRALILMISLVSGRNRGMASPSPVPGEGVLKETEFMMMVEEGHKEGAIHESEMGLIRRVFELDDTTVQEIAQPIHRVLTIPADMTLRAAAQALKSQRYSRIPVTAPGKRVIGVLYAKDMLRARLHPELLEQTVASVMRKPLFVPPKMQLNSLFRRFKQARTHMALVQEAGGPVLGVVTMNDVLNALFEDLLEEEHGGAKK